MPQHQGPEVRTGPVGNPAGEMPTVGATPTGDRATSYKIDYS